MCILIRAKCSLRLFFRIKGTELRGVEFMCRLNAKFALGQNVPDSFTNRIVGLFLGETRAHGSSTHLCRETMVNKQLFSCVLAASSESLAYYQTHFFFLSFFIYMKPLYIGAFSSQFSTFTRIRTPPSNKPSNMKRIYRNLHTLMRVYYYKYGEIK